MKTQSKFMALIIVAVLAGCRDIYVKPADSEMHLADFEATWNRVNAVYPFLEMKGIDWDAMYGVYKQRTMDAHGDEFLQVMCDLLGELKDGHTYLQLNGGDRIYPWYPDREQKDRHLYNPFVVRGYFDTELLVNDSRSAEYGITADNIGYVFLSDFHEGYYQSEFAGIMSYLQNTRGLVIDIRQKRGGSLQNVQAVVAHFSETPVAMPKLIILNEEIPLEPVQPRSPVYFPKPVMVLVNGSTFSAGEVCTEILKQLPYVTVIGDTTGGGGVVSSGDPPDARAEYKLPSGNKIYIGTGYFEKYDGEPFEWSGIVPDVIIQNKPEELEQGIDRQLSLAMETIRFLTKNGKK
ncbi:MAG: S41 family peptidase [Bacteroidales bacterium]